MTQPLLPELFHDNQRSAVDEDDRMEDFIPVQTVVPFAAVGRHQATAFMGGGRARIDDPSEDDAAYRELAVAVFRQAFIDIGVAYEGQGRGITHGAPTVQLRKGVAEQRAGDREEARQFLTSMHPLWRRIRSHWLSWLDLTDDAFQTMLASTGYQGQPNRVAPMLLAMAA